MNRYTNLTSPLTHLEFIFNHIHKFKLVGSDITFYQIYPAFTTTTTTSSRRNNYTDTKMASSSANTTANGTDGASRFDPNFTQHVIDLMSPETKPRERQILASLIKHMHDFCRDVELTQEEWVFGVNYINSLGQAYKKNRNETWRVCDILGIES